MLLLYFLAAVFALHGLAHVSGFLASWTGASSGFGDKPWLLPGGVTLRSPGGRLFGLVWLAAAALLVGSSLALLTGNSWWPALPIAGAIVSLIVMIPWLNVIPPGAKIGALFDGVTLVVLLSPLNEQLMQLLD